MRIAVFTSKYPARVSTFFERDMRSLIDAGVAVDVFPIYPLDGAMWKYSLDLLDDQQLPRHRVHHVGYLESLRRSLPLLRRRLGRCLGDARDILPAAARFGAMTLAKTAYVLPKAWAWAATAGDRYDHVLAYWGNYAATCAYAFHRLLPRPVPFSICLHAGTDLYRTRAFLREKLRYADAIITCCEYNRGYIWRQFALDVREIAPKVHVCHHGLDLAALSFQPDGRPVDRVVGVGRLARHKGFDYLLLAAFLLRSRGIDITVELVGEGPQRPALAALADILGISDRVRLWGWLPFNQTRDIMRGATLLVHPSDGLGDGLPNVVREAMALGTPVVASDVAGIPDALCDGCGVLVPPRDPAALADAVAALLRDPAQRRDIAIRARRRAEERYDMARTGPQLVEILSATRRGGSTADTGIGDYRAVLAGVSR